MDPNQRAAMSQALGASPPMQMPPPGAGAPPGGAPGGAPSPDAPMPPEQAQQFLSSLGISPENLPMVIQAIDAVMAAQGGGGAGAPPPAGAPPA